MTKPPRKHQKHNTIYFYKYFIIKIMQLLIDNSELNNDHEY